MIGMICVDKVLFHNLTCLQVCLQEEEESEHFTLRRLEVEANSIFINLAIFQLSDISFFQILA